MKRSIVGIFPMVENDGRSVVLRNYVDSIEKTGGMAILLPYTKDASAVDRFAEMCDGFLFTGGVDIEPARYSEDLHPACGECSPLRDEVELLAFFRVFGLGKPIMGICRGSQLINVALGGTLYQDLPSQVVGALPHRQGEPHSAPFHEICVSDETPLASLLGEERIAVNSLHHQAVKTPGRGLAVMARADDGVIEATYHTSHPYLRAYQWHPERSFDADPRSRSIFADFLQTCASKAALRDEV